VVSIAVEAVDEDQDGLADGWEVEHDLDPAAADSDGDAIADAEEVVDPYAPADTDGDGTLDALDSDSDGDTIADADEAGDEDLDTSPVDTDDDDVPDFRDDDADGTGSPMRSKPATRTSTLHRATPMTTASRITGKPTPTATSRGASDNCPRSRTPTRSTRTRTAAATRVTTMSTEDEVANDGDTCPTVANPDQLDTDGDLPGMLRRR